MHDPALARGWYKNRVTLVDGTMKARLSCDSDINRQNDRANVAGRYTYDHTLPPRTY